MQRDGNESDVSSPAALGEAVQLAAVAMDNMGGEDVLPIQCRVVGVAAPETGGRNETVCICPARKSLVSVQRKLYISACI